MKSAIPLVAANDRMSARTSSTTLAAEQHQQSSVAPRDEENVPPVEKTEDKQTADPNIVVWEEGDRENPRNWKTLYKCWVTFQLGMLALAASLGSSIISPAENDIARYVGVGREVAVLSISLYMLAPPSGGL